VAGPGTLTLQRNLHLAEY